MRKLKTKDVFAFLRVATEAGIRREIRALADQIAAAGEETDARSVGFDLIFSCLDHLGAKKAEGLVYEFLAGPWEMEPEAIADMDLSEFGDTAKKWATEYLDRETLRSFFGSLASLMR